MRRTTKEINDMIDQCRDYYHDVRLVKDPNNIVADALYSTITALEWALGKKDKLPLLSKVIMEDVRRDAK